MLLGICKTSQSQTKPLNTIAIARSGTAARETTPPIHTSVASRSREDVAKNVMELMLYQELQLCTIWHPTSVAGMTTSEELGADSEKKTSIVTLFAAAGSTLCVKSIAYVFSC